MVLRCDVAVCHPAADSYVAAASHTAGACARAREARKTHRYAVACQPARFYGTIVETGGRISAGFMALLLTLATIRISAGSGFDDLEQSVRDTAVQFELNRYYTHISVGSRRAVAQALMHASTRLCTLADCGSRPSRSARRTAFRARPPTHSQLLTSLPQSSGT